MSDTEPGWHDVKIADKRTRANALRVLSIIKNLAYDRGDGKAPRDDVLAWDENSPSVKAGKSRVAWMGKGASHSGTGLTLNWLMWRGYVELEGGQVKLTPKGEKFLEVTPW